MWDFFPNLPFLYPSLGRNNLNTLPSVNVTVGTDAVTIEIPNHAFFRRNYVLRTAIPAGTTATLPVLIGTNGDTRPLMETEGTAATVANFAGAGIYEIHYNRYTNELYLVNGGFRPITAAAAAAYAQGEATAEFKL